MKTGWVKVVTLVLVAEKIIQHTFVTMAFYFNWKDIRSTVAVSPDALMILGAIAAILFALSLWGLFRQKRWATGLIMGLALFDLVGEFVAQGRLDIVINVSFIVALILLFLSLMVRRRGSRQEG